MLGLAVEAGTQDRVLSGHPHRTGVQVTLAHHDAAGRDERRGGEAELLGAQQGPDGHVPAGAQAPVHLDGDARAQAVQQQGLLGLGQADFPGRACVRQGGQRRGAGAALEA